MPKHVNDSLHWDRNAIQYDCQRCGIFVVTVDALQILFRELERFRLSGVTRNNWERTRAPLWILSTNIEALKSLAPRATDVTEKVAIVLRWICRQSRTPGHWAEIVLPQLYPICYGADVDELHKYIIFLGEKKFVDIHEINQGGEVTYRCIPTIEGWVESQRQPNAESHKAFVAMWFDESVRELYDKVIRPAVEEDCHYKAVRIDRQESNGKIDDEIIAEIRESRFVIADFTGQRGGVYFEAGYAQGMGLQVVWLCRDNDLKNVHFDTRQFNHLVWNANNLPLFRKRLANRVRATIGLGNWLPE
jgi:hypothetical protein